MSKKRGREAHDILENLGKKPSKDSNSQHPSDAFEEIDSNYKGPTFLDDLETADIIFDKDEQFEKAYNNATDADVLLEYLTFLKQLPTNLPTKIKPILTKVKDHLKIRTVMKTVSESNDQSNKLFGQDPYNPSTG